MCGQKSNLSKSGRIRRDRSRRFLPDVAGLSGQYPARSGRQLDAGSCRILPDSAPSASATNRPQPTHDPLNTHSVPAQDPLTRRAASVHLRWRDNHGGTGAGTPTRVLPARYPRATRAVSARPDAVGITVATTLAAAAGTAVTATTATTMAMMTTIIITNSSGNSTIYGTVVGTNVGDSSTITVTVITAGNVVATTTGDKNRTTNLSVLSPFVPCTVSSTKWNRLQSARSSQFPSASISG